MKTAQRDAEPAASLCAVFRLVLAMAAKLAVLLMMLSLVALGPRAASAAAESATRPDPQRRSRAPRRTARKPVPPASGVDYTKFSHRTAAHQKSCDSCHTFPSSNWKQARSGDDAFADVTQYPEHASCLECHRTQFFAKERPAPKICSVCHVAVTPRNTARFPFPNPKEAFMASTKARGFESGFRVHFTHATHLEMMGRAVPSGRRDLVARFVPAAYRPQEAAPADTVCANCHTTYQAPNPAGDYVVKPPTDLGDAFWLKTGTFKTSPGHATCFNCHSADSGLSPGPSDCATCHILKDGAPVATDFDPNAPAVKAVTDPAILWIWRRRQSSATFPHEGGLHTEVGCAHCHDTSAMDTADPATTRVRVQSCGGDMGCHVTATTDDGGALNYEIDERKADPSFVCAKCHMSYGTKPVPAGHAAAISSLKTSG